MINAKVKGQAVHLELNGTPREILLETATLIDDLFDGAVQISPREVRKELLQEFSNRIYEHIQGKIEKL